MEKASGADADAGAGVVDEALAAPGSGLKVV
jgi:hypothetical protein